MKKQALNPYLPGNEYIPDAEPYVFGDRVYIYGSHDRFGAPMFCMNDYVCWSAPTDDLGDWRYEGVIYRKNQDPKNRAGLRLLFAPDVTKGPDGWYYLYYAFDVMGIMGVAVCDSPCGEFQFYGHIQYADGALWGRKKGDAFPFDPGIFVDDDKRIYLYSGFYTPIPAVVTGGKKLLFEGGYVLELMEDMKTIKTPQMLLFPKEGAASFAGHEFFEASSMRKFNGKYYFVYSSRHNHELCYAVSDHPTGGFQFGGTLVSVGDVFLDGRPSEQEARNYLGNTHGSILELNGKYYIFYHRHTNRSSYARQACAEELVMDADGHFQQAEVTSCGLNGGPLPGKGRYEARIACNLWSREGCGRYDCKNPKKRFAAHPYFTQDGKDGDETARQYIANMRDGAVAGFKYFEIEKLSMLKVWLRGDAEGIFRVTASGDGSREVAQIPVSSRGNEWRVFCGNAGTDAGKIPLYFEFQGKGTVDFLEFELVEQLAGNAIRNLCTDKNFAGTGDLQAEPVNSHCWKKACIRGGKNIMIKVIASDMDGTLLGDNHKIAPETLAAIHRACDAGIRFMICTGRNYDSAMEELRGVDLVCDYVLGSGAEVRDPNQQVVLRHEMSMELCQRLAKVLERYPISVIYCTAERDYRIGTVEEVEESFIQQVGLFHLEMSREEILKSELYQRVRKKTVILSDFEELKTIGAPVFKVFLFAEDLKMLKEMEQELSKDPEIAVASSFITNLEITAVQAQKGPVLKQYIESLGYTMDEVMVLGDSMNDYSMLSMPFGATIAMENAMPEIKAVAKYITKSNEELGVAYAIDELLKRQG